MNTSIYKNVTGFEFVYAVNYDTQGFLLTALLFAFFLILLISMFKIGKNDVWENMAVTSTLTIIPATILSTQAFLGVSVIQIWVPIFFIFIAALGLGGMYFTSKS